MLSQLLHLLKRIARFFSRLVIGILKIAWWFVQLLFKAIGAIAKPSMRFLAFLCFAIATVALVADLTPSLSSDQPFSTTTLAEHWHTASPRSLTAAKVSVTSATGEWLWDILRIWLLNLPTFFLFGVLGLLAAYAGQRRKILNVYTN